MPMGELRQQGRKSPRLQGYDYTRSGTYFVTICAHHREHLFGEILDDEMCLNAYGRIAFDCWQSIPEHFVMVELDAFVVMPNHVHGVLWITSPDDDAGARHASPLPDTLLTQKSGTQPASLGAIVGSYKSAVTRQINQIRQTPSARVWQRSYHDHIIRTEKALNQIRQYVHHNPALWMQDSLYT